MSDELRVQISGSSALPIRSRAALEKELTIFGDEVFQEAGRLEDETEDISPRTIRQMAEFVRRKNREPSEKVHSLVTITADATSYVAAVIGGFFFNNIEKRWGAIGAIICVFIGVAAFFIARRGASR